MLLASFLSGISSLSVFLSSNLFFFYGVAMKYSCQKTRFYNRPYSNGKSISNINSLWTISLLIPSEIKKINF